MNGSRAVPYDRGAAAIAPDRKTFRQLVGVALAQGDPIAYRYLLLLRFTLANGIALALIGAAAGQGRVGMIFTCRADLGFRGGVQKPGVRRRLRPAAAPAAPAGRVSKRHSAFKLGRSVTPITLLDGFNAHVDSGKRLGRDRSPPKRIWVKFMQVWRNDQKINC